MENIILLDPAIVIAKWGPIIDRLDQESIGDDQRLFLCSVAEISSHRMAEDLTYGITNVNILPVVLKALLKSEFYKYSYSFVTKSHTPTFLAQISVNSESVEKNRDGLITFGINVDEMVETQIRTGFQSHIEKHIELLNEKAKTASNILIQEFFYVGETEPSNYVLFSNIDFK